MISGVSKVVVPVDDQERAKDFWVDRLGFELRRDESYGDERWIEVSPPGQDLLLALSRRTAQEARQELPDQLPHSPLFFNCADIEQTYRELTERGVDFPAPTARCPWRGARSSRPRRARIGTAPDLLVGLDQQVAALEPVERLGARHGYARAEHAVLAVIRAAPRPHKRLQTLEPGIRRRGR